MPTKINNPSPPSLIFGRITDAQNRPMPNLLVYAYDRDMRSEELLGEAITDREGKYEIQWDGSLPDTRGKRTADLVLRVLTRERQTLLYASDMDSIRFNAGPREEINVMIGQAIPSEVVEFDFIMGEIRPLMGKVAMQDLEENDEFRDISFLSKETEIAFEKIEHLVVAHRLQAASEIEAAFFYALLRKNTLLKNDWSKAIRLRLDIGLETDILPLLYDVALIDAKIIRQDVTAASQEMIVSKKVAKGVKRYLLQLRAFHARAESYYQKEYPQKVLDTIGHFVQQNKLAEMARIFEENKYDLNAFFKKINSPEFFASDGTAVDANLSVLLGDLLGFNTQLIETVKADQGIKKPADIRQLAALNKAGWQAVLTKSVADQGEKTLDKKLIDHQASVLTRKLEKEFPTVAYAAQLGREKKTVLHNQSAIQTFLEKHEDFDLQHSNVDLFLKSKKMTKPAQNAMREELKSVQRVFKLVPHYGKTNALLQQNIHSAQSIVAAGEQHFVNEIATAAGIQKAEAQQIFRTAERTNTAAMLVVGELQSTMRAMDIAAIETSGLALKLNKVAGDFPNLKTLFKLGDVCACEHCHSVYSPAAYLVEVLQFLEKRITLSGVSAKTELFSRRPDLGDIDLSCENANTPLPYIDLVCELLEAEVAPEAGIPYKGVLSGGADPLAGVISTGTNSLFEALKDKMPVTKQAQIFKTEVVPGAPTTFPHYLRDKKVVCKIAENSPGNYTITRLRQTLSTAEELAAAPEYVNESAYIELNTAIYAFELPFDLNHTEAKAYFDRFGIDRANLMQDFQVTGAPAEKTIAAELLGLTEVEWHLIVKSIPNLTYQQLIWNAPNGESTLVDYMKRVDHFLDKTGLSFQEANLLLSLRFIDQVGKLFIEHHYDDPTATNPTISCNTTKKEIAHLDDDALDRIHRFLRLQKKTGWKFETLDEIINQSLLGGGQLNDACLIHASNLALLSEKTGISVDELIGFYHEIPFTEYASSDSVPLYHQIFLNKARNGFVDERLLPQNVNAFTLLSDLKTSLSVCLQVSEQDVEQLIMPLSSPVLVFDHLSYLFAATRLMRQLKLTARDFVALAALTGIDFQNSPVDTLAFVQAAQEARELPLKPAEVRFMLWHDVENLDSRKMNDEKIQQILEGLQADFQKALLTMKSPFDPTVSVDEQKGTLKTQLSKLVGLAEVDVEILAYFLDANWNFTWVDGSNSTITSTDTTGLPAYLHFKLDKFFGAIGVTTIASFINPLDTANADAPLKKTDYDNAVIDVKLAQTAYTNAVGSAAKAAAKAQLDIKQLAATVALQALEAANDLLESSRKNLLEALFFRIEFQTAKTAVLEETISSSFKTDLELTKTVLKYAQLKQGLPGTDILSNLLTSIALLDASNDVTALLVVDETNFLEQYQSLRLLHKMLPLIAAFKLDTPAVEWHFQNNDKPILKWFLWDEIPYQPGQARAVYDRFVTFAQMVARSKTLTPVANPADAENPVSFYALADLMLSGTVTRTEFIERLALLTGFDKTDVDTVDAYLFSNVTWGVNIYNNPINWQRVETCIAQLRTLGSTIAQVTDFIKPILTDAEVKTLRAALKSRYDEDTWLGTLKEIMDAIRPQKRDALVAYLLAVNPDFNNENDLYDYFLVDVEMEACMPSSRILQAHGVVQLFVQRCLMGLEPNAIADVEKDTYWDQWKWMKNYRVWEANRKVFLYPENWIEPELRDDKSFLFTELENEIQQNELTEFTAEEALIKYLEKLDDIAFLEVMATWYETDIKTMHVFARTKGGDPAIYYYRRFEQERYWTPWEKVELDITGDHLLAFVRNHRLTLAWPVFSEEPDEKQKAKIPAAGNGQEREVGMDKPKRRLKIQLAMSEFANQTWQPKKISKEGILTPTDSTTSEVLLWRDNYNLMYLEATEQVMLFYSYLRASDSGQWQQSESHMVSGIFNLKGCKGYPELALEGIPSLTDFFPDFKNARLKSTRYNEIKYPGRDGDPTPPEDLAVKNIASPFDFIGILETTPGTFRLTYPHQISALDLISPLLQWMMNQASDQITDVEAPKISRGFLLPYFMEDSDHAYVVLPGFYRTDRIPNGTVLVKKTASDVFQLINDVKIWITSYRAKPPMSQEEWALWIAEFHRIAADLQVYRGLLYGEQFKNMYHPLVCSLRTTLYRDGIPALMKRETQQRQTPFDFQNHYQPSYRVPQPYPVEDVDFSSDGSYSGYNWELFFHVPFLIATRLTKEQRFEEAMAWFHYMFNPTGALPGPVPQKYWVTKPFFEFQNADYLSQRINDLLYNLSDPATDPQLKADLEFAVTQWRIKPFQPHVIARFRPVAYQKAVLMKYVDNLIEWGDYLFRQDTMESIVQATQMYILADKLLGDRPRTTPPVVTPPYETYNQMAAKLDAFGNALIDLENILPDLSALPEQGAELPAAPVTLSMLYFCIPQNDKVLEYWDRVADRLFKIRHCQNIDGVERSLALFSPPIDPGMLVRAAAAGLDISAVLAGINAPTPYYRFNVLSQKATELVNEVRGLGSSLLQALEKKDAEAMSLLRSELEIKVLNAVRDMKKLQINESKEQIEVLKRTKKVTEERQHYYASIEKISSKEQLNLDKLGESQDYQMASQVVRIVAGALSMIPDVKIGVSGFGGTPEAGFTMGGTNFSRSTNIAADVLSFLGSIASYEASRASTLGGYDRRFDDWQLQERLANLELNSIEKQIVAAEIRKEIAETDLKNHDLQIENAKKTDEFMRTKYTNKELYEWMAGQISSVYFRSYQLAHDFAKKAERCYRFELGNDDKFIAFGYWDSRRKGLQSADQLLHDLKRMETGYLDKNKREYEITKHVSLSMLDPLALVRLRATGVCDFDVPEALFDLDHAGQYFRRIKSVSISLPCIAGPYTSVSAKLSLVKNKYRKNVNPNSSTSNGYPEDTANGDDRFTYNIGAIQSIAASNSQNDSGVFELNFRDERYLPFEGTGAISSWRLELPTKSATIDLSQFDYDTISDVILHVKYTSREGGSSLRTAAEAALKDQLKGIRQQLAQEGMHVAINLKHDMPNEWHLLKQTYAVDLKIEKSRLPFMAQLLPTATIDSVMLIAKMKKSTDPFACTILNETNSTAFAPVSDWGLLRKNTTFIQLETSFNLSASQADLQNLEELMLVVKYVFI